MNRILVAMPLLMAVALTASNAVAAPVVLFGPDVDAAQAAARVEDELALTDVSAIEALELRTGVSGSIAVGAPYVSCQAPALRTLKGELLRLDQQMTDMDYQPARQTAAAIVGQIACYGSDASRDDLYELFFAAGIAAYYDGDHAAAQGSFSQATAIDPSRPWPRDYPPTAKPLYDEALRIMTASPPSRVADQVEGDVIVDGKRDFGMPRLYPGGHLIFVPETGTSMWVTIPFVPPLSDDGLVIVSSADLLQGLMQGNDLFAPWLVSLAETQGWSELVLVSSEQVLTVEGGAFFTADGVRVQRPEMVGAQTRSAPPGAIAGFALVGAGAGAAAVGLGLNISSYQRGLPQVGGLRIPLPDYRSAKQQNTAGLVLTVAGAGIVAAGLTVAIVSLAAPRAKLAAVPWVTGDGTSWALGITGSLP